MDSLLIERSDGDLPRQSCPLWFHSVLGRPWKLFLALALASSGWLMVAHSTIGMAEGAFVISFGNTMSNLLFWGTVVLSLGIWRHDRRCRLALTRAIDVPAVLFLEADDEQFSHGVRGAWSMSCGWDTLWLCDLRRPQIVLGFASVCLVIPEGSLTAEELRTLTACIRTAVATRSGRVLVKQ